MKDRNLKPENYAKRCISLGVDVKEDHSDAFCFFDTLRGLRLFDPCSPGMNLRSGFSKRRPVNFSPDPLDDMGAGVGYDGVNGTLGDKLY